MRPVAGAIAYLKYRLPIRSARLAERIRTEQSVLIVPGAMFGLGKGFRVGFGFDMEQTRKALDRVATVLADVAGAPEHHATSRPSVISTVRSAKCVIRVSWVTTTAAVPRP